MGIVETLSGALQPWADLYSGSTPVEGTIVFLHLGSMLVAGGLALSADRSILRTARHGPDFSTVVLHELAAVHGIVITALVVLIVSGVLMLLADVEALLPSPWFWAKMAGFALLLGNGALLRKREVGVLAGVEGSGPDGWGGLRAAAVRSSALWLIVLLLGSILPLVV